MCLLAAALQWICILIYLGVANLTVRSVLCGPRRGGI
jgi:hypothetical protein